MTKADFDWAVAEAARKKKTDFSKVEWFTYDEGLCVQCMHIGSYDDEPATVALMDSYARENGYVTDIFDTRFHHEIYLSDARKVASEKLKRMVAIHTVMNKLTGALLFLLPLTLQFVDLSYSAAIVCCFATFAAVQEGHYIRAEKINKT